MPNVIFFTVILFIFSGCASQEAAPIEYNYEKNIDENHSQYLETIEAKPIQETVSAKPANIYNDSETILEPIREEKIQNKDKIIYHEVQKGETLSQLAQSYEQTEEEIAQLNNLQHPYNLEDGQIIKLKVNNEILNKKNSGNSKQLNITHNIKDSNASSLPTIVGTVISKFGEKTNNGVNNGINIESKLGAEVKSIKNGKVIFSGNDKKFGNIIIVKIDDSDLTIAYAHLNDLLFAKNDIVKDSEIIGHVGRSGNITKAQLHIAFREGKIAVDPLKYIQIRNDL